MTDADNAISFERLPSDSRIRKRMILKGILQGIGCRPTVYRLATSLGLSGWVVNTTSSLRIEIEGTREQCTAFENALPEAIPPPGAIRHSHILEIAPQGERGFRIEQSLQERPSVAPIPPDVATCRECVSELLDPGNHRYLYPFITCTLCGPRFTVVRSFPYDRERTSMADFTMCPRCAKEYADPEDRRFHSQTNSCPECGPRLSLVTADGNPLPGDPVVETIRVIAQGKVIAIKGIGGFHLACDALNEEAVGILRQRKGREEKPFAVMMPDLLTIASYCEVTRIEEALLASQVAPIVLLKTKGRIIARNVAPFIGTLGVMLPYSPVHHLLFKHPAVAAGERPTVLVMTSGNRSEEPIAAENSEALARLRDLADAFLLHDRDIVLRADDSIFRVISGRPTVFRRSRGLVPAGFPISFSRSTPKTDADFFGSDEGPEETKISSLPVVVAAGGDLKNAVALIKDDQVVPGPHVGDLASPVAQDYFRQSAEVLTNYLEAEPEVAAVDAHPGYFSNSLGHEMGLPVVEVFHHHAHAASLLFEHGLSGPALFAVFDGTGYGPDGTIWGGEFLVADRESFHRAAHIGLFPLPGGEAAIREPARILVGLLAEAGAVTEELLPLTEEFGGQVAVWLEAVKREFNSPFTSSAGRLFDAAAVTAGFTRIVTFEGEAAMWLEGKADPAEKGEYPVVLAGENPIVVDPRVLIRALASDMLSGRPTEVAAGRFHNSMARVVADVAERLARKTGIRMMGLTGGCFQNRLFAEKAEKLLQTKGFEVLMHRSVPPNDGGIALGQAVCAGTRWASSNSRWGAVSIT